MSIRIHDTHWLVADWIMRNVFKDILFEIEHSYEKHDALKDKIEKSIKLHTYFLEFDTKNEMQSISDLGFLIMKSENRKYHNASKDENPGEIIYLNKISELKLLIESNFRSATSDIIFDSVRLEKEYRSSIWLYLEKLTYFLIYLNKELGSNIANSELLEVDQVETNFTVQYYGDPYELTNKKLFQKLISLIPRNEKLLSAVIYLGKDQKCGIINYGAKKMTHDWERVSEIHRVFKIRQEWGGSYWKARFASTKIDSEFDAVLYEEINQFKMEFTFKLSTNSDS